MNNDEGVVARISRCHPIMGPRGNSSSGNFRRTPLKPTRTKTPNVTGRDDYLVNSGIAFAINTIQNLPASMQRKDELRDLHDLLTARLPSAFLRARTLLEARTLIDMGQQPSLQIGVQSMDHLKAAA